MVSRGNSFGASTLCLFVGLGDATAIDGVDVTWPVARGCAASSPVQTFKGLVPAHHYLLKQGTPAPQLLTRPTAPLSRSAAPHVHR